MSDIDGQLAITDYLKSQIKIKNVMDLTAFINSQSKAQYKQIEDIVSKTYERNKAIDDFAEKIIRYVDCGHLCSPTEIRWSDLAVVEMVKRIAEQLKAGDGE